VIYAVVPAAGKSTRMGRPKLTLPLGDRTVLERVIATLRGGALRAGGADRVLVVVGPHVPELAPLAEVAGADVGRLAAETADMRATVEHGLRWLEDHLHPRPDDAWLLAPADHPALDADVVRQLCVSYSREPGQTILVPTYGGRRGHPTLIEWRHVPGIRALPAGQGIDAYLRAHAEETLELPVASAGVLCDLDTPEDYERLRRVWHG
jgi:molybdenum cofactor cytidylyltransferase